MSENITIFQNPEFGNIRTMRDEKGEPLFCAKDVCDALGYDQARKAVQRHVDEGDGTKHTLIDSLGKGNKPARGRMHKNSAPLISSKQTGGKQNM